MSMSTQEWLAALGMFLAYPKLLIATLIIISAVSGFAWWLRGYIDRAHIDTLKSRIDGAEAALRENEHLKQKVEDLERENTGFRRQVRAKEEVVLDEDTNRVLVHMFKANRPIDFDAMATGLGMEKNILQYHLDRLNKYGFADRTNLNSLDQKIYWRLQREGRRRVVQSKLMLIHP